MKNRTIYHDGHPISIGSSNIIIGDDSRQSMQVFVEISKAMVASGQAVLTEDMSKISSDTLTTTEATLMPKDESLVTMLTNWLQIENSIPVYELRGSNVEEAISMVSGKYNYLDIGTQGELRVFEYDPGLGDVGLELTDIPTAYIRLMYLVTAIELAVRSKTHLCIAYPEIMLGPDHLRVLGEWISQHDNITIFTESTELLNYCNVSDVIVPDRHRGGYRRLEEANFTDWLKTYSLGVLWVKGVLY